jgi:hypothetical protein
MDLAVIPECYVDTNLIETLVPPVGKGYNHKSGCGGVTKVMQEKFSDRFAVGIIDRDKKQVKYLNEFILEINAGSLMLHKHKTKHHYIIQINPAVEAFIIQSANSVGILITDFDLPADRNLLQKISKTLQGKKDPRFRNLFEAIYRAGAVDFLKLAKWVKYLRDNNYHADVNDIM